MLTTIIGQIIICLIVALLLGFLFGWLMSSAIKRERHESRIKDFVEEANNKDNIIDNLENELKVVKRELVDGTEEIRAYEKSLQSKEIEFKSVQNKLKATISLLKDSEYKIETLSNCEQENKALMHEVDALRKKDKELEEKIESFQNKHEDNLKIKSELEKKLEECKNSLFDMENTFLSQNKKPEKTVKEEVPAPEKTESENSTSDIIKSIKSFYEKLKK